MRRVLAVLLSLTVLLVTGCNGGARMDERAITAVLSSPQLRDKIPAWDQFPRTSGKKAGRFSLGGPGGADVAATFESVAARVPQGYHVSFTLVWVEGGERRYTVMFDVPDNGEATYLGEDGAPPASTKK